MQKTAFTSATMGSGPFTTNLTLLAGPAPLGASDVVQGVLDPHRTAVAPSPEWRRLARQVGTMVSALIGRTVQAARVSTPRRA